MSVKSLVIPRRNGGLLHAELYSISEDERDKFPPLVIMCHGGKGDKLEWEIKPRKNKLVIEVMPVSTGKKGEGV